jgi:hypothetical protein
MGNNKTIREKRRADENLPERQIGGTLKKGLKSNFA